MQKRVNLCLVGVGRVSTSHFEAIANLSELVNLTAVMSRNENNLKIAADKWGAQKTYSSYEKMLKDPDIDAVIICLPHHLHESATITAAQAKKHILCEKPMAITGQQCRNMVKAADDNNVTLMIGQSRRFYDAVLKSKEIISAGHLGKILSINEWNYSLRVEAHPSSWRLDMDKSGGRIMPLWGAHLLDYILWIMEEKPKYIFARMLSNNPAWQGEDEAMVFMGFDQGEMANIHLSWNARIKPAHKKDEVVGKIWDSKKNSIYERYIIGEKGTLYMNDETELYFNGDLIVSGEQEPNNFTLQLKEFAHALQENREPIASGREVIKVIDTIEAAFKSSIDNFLITIK